jgi:large subunit ribosomal protein L25
VNAAARPKLAAESRTVTGKAVARLRREGRLPAVVYGHGTSSSNVSLDAHEFELFRKHSGANTLLDLVVDKGKATPALVHGVQIHPVSRKPLHIDLFAVTMTEELTVEVPVVTTGSSILLERESGTLSHAIPGVRVRALPDHLPNSIEVSIDGLTSFDQAIHVRDLTIPSDVTLLTDPDEVVIRILPPRVIEEVAPAAEAAEGAEEGAAATEGGQSAAEGEATEAS